MTTLLISAGDASGDLHAAEFVRAFRAQHPDARILGLGGDEMRRAGVELVVHQRDLAVGGLLELGRSLAKIVSNRRLRLQTLYGVASAQTHGSPKLLPRRRALVPTV